MTSARPARMLDERRAAPKRGAMEQPTNSVHPSSSAGQATGSAASLPTREADHPDWLERSAALCGIAFVVMALLYIFLSPAAGTADSPQSVARTYAEHRTAGLFWNEIGALSFFFYLFFLGALYNRLRRAEAGTGWLSLLALAGGLGFVAVHAVETLTAVVLAWHIAPQAASGGDESTVQALFDLGNLTVFYDVVPSIVGFAAVALLVFRTGVFPRWLGWLAGGMTVAGFASALGITNPQSTFAGISVGLWTILELFVYTPSLVYFLIRPPRNIP
ncbi:MAG: hypothetical protein ACJ786_23315 [Catenulispora sp.]